MPSISHWICNALSLSHLSNKLILVKEIKTHHLCENRHFLDLFYLPPESQQQEEWLTCYKLSINTCWMHEWINEWMTSLLNSCALFSTIWMASCPPPGSSHHIPCALPGLANVEWTSGWPLWHLKQCSSWDPSPDILSEVWGGGRWEKPMCTAHLPVSLWFPWGQGLCLWLLASLGWSPCFIGAHVEMSDA